MLMAHNEIIRLRAISLLDTVKTGLEILHYLIMKNY